MSDFIKSLNLTQKDDLQEVLGSPGLRILLKWLENSSDALVQDVISYDLSSGNDRELALRKARAEGAKKLVKSFRLKIDQVKNAKMKA